jgi:lipopolysaccharide/colanic/teichoic acid biosynthesis glycosyltransferase
MSVAEDVEAIRLPEIVKDFHSIPIAAHPAFADQPSSIDTKRVLDIVAALAALILCAPLMLVIFLSLSVLGNPVFVQRRVGRGGQMFDCYKFRSMVHQADFKLTEYLRTNAKAREEWSKTFKLAYDPRITPIGRFLRKSSLDELPQLFNVLRGDMSLVGPRPIVPAEVVRYAGRIKDYHRCRPGITGLWQVSGRNLTTYRRRVALDVVYARRRSIGLDIIILLRTVWVVIVGRGAR